MNEFTKEYECSDCKHYCRFFCFEDKKLQVTMLCKCKIHGIRTADDDICKKFELSDKAKRYFEMMKHDKQNENNE